MDLSELQALRIQELSELAKTLNIDDDISGLNKQELTLKILEAQAKKDGSVFAKGILEVMHDGYGFLRSSDYNYLNSPDDIYVSQHQIRNFGLKTGDTIEGKIRPPKEGEKYFPLVNVDKVNGRGTDEIKKL